jgi:hypothetical protein
VLICLLILILILKSLPIYSNNTKNRYSNKDNKALIKVKKLEVGRPSSRLNTVLYFVLLIVRAKYKLFIY